MNWPENVTIGTNQELTFRLIWKQYQPRPEMAIYRLCDRKEFGNGYTKLLVSVRDVSVWTIRGWVQVLPSFPATDNRGRPTGPTEFEQAFADVVEVLS